MRVLSAIREDAHKTAGICNNRARDAPFTAAAAAVPTVISSTGHLGNWVNSPTCRKTWIGSMSSWCSWRQIKARCVLCPVPVIGFVVILVCTTRTKVLLFLLIMRYPVSNNNSNNNCEPHPSIMSNKKAAKFEFEVRPCALLLPRLHFLFPSCRP